MKEVINKLFDITEQDSDFRWTPLSRFLALQQKNELDFFDDVYI